jgi:hypothetical protein
MARRIAGVGLVTVSDLKSMGGRFMVGISNSVIGCSDAAEDSKQLLAILLHMRLRGQHDARLSAWGREPPPLSDPSPFGEKVPVGGTMGM